MRNFNHNKRGWRNIAESKPVLIFLGVVALVFAWNVLGFWKEMGETEKNRKLAEEKVLGLERQKETFSSEIEILQTDAGKERVFREDLGLVKEGEDLIVIVEDKNKSAGGGPDSGGFFNFFKNLFE